MKFLLASLCASMSFDSVASSLSQLENQAASAVSGLEDKAASLAATEAGAIAVGHRCDKNAARSSGGMASVAGAGPGAIVPDVRTALCPAAKPYVIVGKKTIGTTLVVSVANGVSTSTVSENTARATTNHCCSNECQYGYVDHNAATVAYGTTNGASGGSHVALADAAYAKLDRNKWMSWANRKCPAKKFARTKATSLPTGADGSNTASQSACCSLGCKDFKGCSFHQKTDNDINGDKKDECCKLNIFLLVGIGCLLLCCCGAMAYYMKGNDGSSDDKGEDVATEKAADAKD